MNDASGFDPNVFLGATISQANTRRPPIPAGTVLRGTLGEAKGRQTEGKKDSNQGVVYNWIDVPIKLDLTTNQAVRDLVGQDEVTLTHSFTLDVKGSGLDMSPGKNTGLRLLREALDMNRDGSDFTLLQIAGRQVNCMIGNRPYQGENYDEIRSISKIT